MNRWSLLYLLLAFLFAVSVLIDIWLAIVSEDPEAANFWLVMAAVQSVATVGAVVLSINSNKESK